MKKTFVLLLALLSSGIISAQDNASSASSVSKLRFGFKVAPSLAWLKPDVKNFDSNGSKIGFIYGIIMDYNFAKNYAFGTGLEVSYRGGKLKYNYPFSSGNTVHTYSGEDTYNIKYIELPLTIKMKTNEIGYMTYYGQFGFQPGFKISAKEDFTQTKTTPSGPDEVTGDSDANADVASVNISILFGVGLEYRISGNTSILVGLQFTNGFTDILTGTNHQDTSTELKAISNYFSLNVGVFF
jgi:Outer membrane protein beta-barrel domain